jgi:hypothetical protein
MAAKRASETPEPKGVLGQRQKPAKMFRAGLYARMPTHNQQNLRLQMRAARDYTSKGGWMIVVQIKEVGSAAVERELREKLPAAARRRRIDVVPATGSLGQFTRSGRYIEGNVRVSKRVRP